jgi:phosphatidylethanolamine/phosphatidyl-N-methylethanolamine N-methyltransferase
VQRSTDQTLFLKSWLKRPLMTGAVAPSSSALADLITRDLRPDGGPVIELGPGTGAFTRSILARGVSESDLTLVEKSPDFATLLRQRFPRATLLEMDAADLRPWNPPVPAMQAQAVISGLPLLNMGLRTQWNVLRSCMHSLREDGALYQFTYLAKCPISPEVLERMAPGFGVSHRSQLTQDLGPETWPVNSATPSPRSRPPP